MSPTTTAQDIMGNLTGSLADFQSDIGTIGTVLAGILVVAAVIWTTALAWRKFKETTNKV